MTSKKYSDSFEQALLDLEKISRQENQHVSSKEETDFLLEYSQRRAQQAQNLTAEKRRELYLEEGLIEEELKSELSPSAREFVPSSALNVLSQGQSKESGKS